MCQVPTSRKGSVFNDLLGITQLLFNCTSWKLKSIYIITPDKSTVGFMTQSSVYALTEVVVISIVIFSKIGHCEENAKIILTTNSYGLHC